MSTSESESEPAMFRAWMSRLPVTAIGNPGPQRDELTRLVLVGAKTATTSLLADYEREGEPLPIAGANYRLIGSGGEPLAVVEVTEVRVVRFDQVDDDHARAEGEGCTDSAHWRTTHREEWPQVVDSSEVVLERFRVVARTEGDQGLEPSESPSELPIQGDSGPHVRR